MGSDRKKRKNRVQRFGRNALASSSSSAKRAHTSTKENLPKATAGDGSSIPSLPDHNTEHSDTKEPDQSPAVQSNNRYICFIGNLPFTSTAESISRHFIKLKPISIRHSTDKVTGKSKGFAFVEFEGFDRMKTCLQQYHHSTFDDSLSPPRKINVELTTGGGGAKSLARKSKIQSKNRKLNGERTRRMLREANPSHQDTKDVESNADASDHIHPSRRKQMHV